MDKVLSVFEEKKDEKRVTEVIKGEEGGDDKGVSKVLSVFEEKKDEKRVTEVIKGEEGGDDKGVSKVLSVFEEQKSENSDSQNSIKTHSDIVRTR